jgi:hypothetical protein
MRPERTLPAVLGILLAVVAFLVHAVLGFFLSLAAVVLGAIGLLLAASPRRRGALMSACAVLLGLAGVVVQVLRGVLDLLF